MLQEASKTVSLDSTDKQLIGKTLGTCTLQRLLGRGGMGAVYLAQQSRPRRTVAVKLLLPELSQETTKVNEFLVRFRREADAIAALDHVHIMPIYEYGEQGQLAFLVMPYVTGGTLRDVMVKRGKLQLGEAIKVVEQTASALDYAHEHGIVHRDLKPGNILFHADGRLMLTDFGIAKVVSESAEANLTAMQTLTTAGTIIGTPEYLSPEQASGGLIDRRADIYSLGVVLFQMLTGQVPFTGTTPVAVAIKHAIEIPPQLALLNPAIPLSVEQVIIKAMAKKPEQRYSTAGEMAQALRVAASLSDAQTLVTSSPASSPLFTQGEGTVPIVLRDNASFETALSASAGSTIDTPPAGEKINTSPTMAATPSSSSMPEMKQVVLAAGASTSVPPVTPSQPQPRQRSRGRLPLWIGLLSFVLIVVLMAGGGVLYFHLLPNGKSTASGVHNNVTPVVHITATTSIPATATDTPPTVLPKAAIPVGSFLYGTIQPLCGGQRNLWTLNSSVSVSCESGDTRLTNNTAGQGIAVVMLNSLAHGTPIPNDYILQMQVKAVSPSSSSAFGVYFRMQTGAGHHGAYSFMLQPSGAWTGNSIDDGTGQPSNLQSGAGYGIGSGFITVDILVQGDTFKLYYNGGWQGGIQTGGYTSGAIGLAVDSGADVQFKNLAIYAQP